MTQVFAMPHCCSALVLADFGESYTAEGGAHTVNEEKLEREIKLQLHQRAKCGYGIVLAFTNNEQVKANKVLRKLKFKSSKWVTKKIHPETRLKLWYFNLENISTLPL